MPMHAKRPGAGAMSPPPAAVPAPVPAPVAAVAFPAMMLGSAALAFGPLLARLPVRG